MKLIYLSALAAAGMTMAVHAEENTQATYTSDFNQSLKAFNPAVSVIVDTFYYHEDSEDGMGHIKEGMTGFGHGHAEDEHGHGHGVENGFNLRHLELAFQAEIDGYFKALAIAAIEEEGAEIEVAEIETTGLPWGFQAKAGKFFSDFGYINAQHEHQWDFADQPLIHELALGSHGLNEKGVQLSWLAPTPFYLLFGAEVFQGENEKMYMQAEGEATELPENDGPRLGVGWVKLAPFQFDNSELQLGLFGASGSHQEVHEEGGFEYGFDGDNMFAGFDAVYKYDSGKAYGQGDAVVQAEYFYRDKDLELADSDDGTAEIGEKLTGAQDGYYIQGTYGIFPRWRAGLRWEQVGLTNEETEEGVTEEFGDSWRASAMVDFRPSEFSQIRFQVNNGDYEFAHDDGDIETENVWEAFVQLTVSLGAHGAHDF